MGLKGCIRTRHETTPALALPKLFKGLATALLVASVSMPAVAQQTQPTPRSRDTRGNDERTAQFRCLSEAKVAYASYAGPQAAREPGQSAYFMSCLVKAMPEDWSGASQYRKRALASAEVAQRTDPEIDACLLTACAPSASK
jgi:hypothetical protein